MVGCEARRVDCSESRLGPRPSVQVQTAQAGLAQAHDRLMTSVHELNEVVEALEKRMAPLLRPRPEVTPDDCVASLPADFSPFASVILGNVHGVERAIRMVRVLIEAVDLP